MSKVNVVCLLAASAAVTSFAGLVAYDVGDYVQDGLIVHFDGIRNAGAALPHASDASRWVNLSTDGGDLVFDSSTGGGVTSGWTERGYLFDTNIWAKSETKVTPGAQHTVQFVGNYDGVVAHRSDTSVFPQLFGLCHHSGPLQYPPSFYTRWQDGAARLEWRTDIYAEMSTRPMLANWSGRNFTAVIEEKKSYLMTGDSRNTGVAVDLGAVKTYVASSEIVVGQAFAGDFDGMRGEVQSIRIYNRPLTDAEIARNNAIDRFRFRGERLVTNVVVRSSRYGLAGTESGNCQVDGSHVFTAPATCQTADGQATFACAGYRLETWDDQGEAWGTPVEYADETSYAYEVGESPAKVRLTWLWRQVSGLVRSEPSDYVQEGLITQFDAIRGGGSFADRRVWRNLVDPEAHAWLIDIVGKAGYWTDSAVCLRGGSFLQMARGVTVPEKTTVEVAADAVFVCQTSTYFYLFGLSDDGFDIFNRNNGSWELKAVNPLSTSVRLNLPSADMNGKYVTVTLDRNAATLASDTNHVVSKTGTFAGPVGLVRFMIGSGDKVKLSEMPAKTCLTGEYRSFRVYDRVLSPEEQAHNRMIDEERFYGVMAVTNVVVASLSPALEARTGLGNFRVMGSHTFHAPCARAEKDGRVYVQDGYRLDRWDAVEGDWLPIGRFDGDAYTFAEDGEYDKVRLTWLWKRGGGLVAYDADDYVQDGLQHNFDAIRNVGLDLPHQADAAKWLDLVETGANFSFTLNEASTAGWRAGDRYACAGTSFGTMSIPLFLPESSTIQCVLDDLDFSHATMAYPSYFTRSDDNFNFFTRGSGSALEWKHKAQNPRKTLSSWNGREFSAIMTDSKFYLTQTAQRGTASNKAFQSDFRNLKHTVNIGSQNSKDLAKSYANCSYHAVRVYGHALPDWELAHNRMIDTVRFRGQLPITNVVVASEMALEGVEKNGPYQVGERYAFTAKSQVLDGHKYRPYGYELETWDAASGQWTDKTTHRGAAYVYEVGTAPAKVRLTWLWTAGMVLLVK